MIKITRFFLCCALGLFFQGKMSAQLSGTFNIPVNYPTLAAAITALNTQGVNGPVFIELSAGYTETAPAGGYSLTATGTVLNPITFRKTGSGANPLLTAYTGGTGTPGAATQDGVWRIIGSDYITIEGIDITDPNTSNPATMEYGLGFFKAGTSDGCQNNTVRNCAISLKVVNNATGSGPAADGSRGINMVNSLFTSQTTALTPASFAGTHSNNKFYGNTIRNCNVGIALIGYAAPGPFTLADRGNDIGGAQASEGNTIVNFGGAVSATNPAAGVRTLAQYDLNVSNNFFNNNDGGGSNHVAALRGIYVNTAASANVSLLNNTITLNGGGTTAQVCAIENAAGATAAGNTVSIANNVIQNCSNSANTTGSFFGIYNNAASASYLDIIDNTLFNITTSATTGANYLVYNTGAVAARIRITGNLVKNCTNTASTSGAYYTVFNNVASSAALDISSNTFTNNITSAATGATHLIYNASATSSSITLNNNVFGDCMHTSSSTGVFYGIYNNGVSAAVLEIRANAFTNHTVNAFSGATNLIYNTAAIANGIRITGNSFSNCSNTITSTGAYYAIYNNAASSTDLDISGNSFAGNTLAATTGSVHLIFNRGTATNTFVSTTLNNNLISNCSYSGSSAPFLGIYNSGVTSDNLSISNNTVSGTTWFTTGSAKYMLYNTGPVSAMLNLNANLISGCSSTNNTTGTFNGISNAATCTVALNMCNNRVENIRNTSTTGGTYLMLNAGAVPGGAITLTNNAVSGCSNTAAGLGDFYGISNSGTTYSTLELTYSTFSNNVITSATGVTGLIYNTGAVTTSINSISLQNNLISGCTSSVSANGSFFGIYNNAASCVNLDMSNNTFSTNASYATNGANHLIYNRGAVTNTFSQISIDNNLISGCTHSSSAAAGFYSIWNNGVTSTVTSISNNTITSSAWESSTATRYLISNWGVALTLAAINNNLISNCTHTNNTTAGLLHIYNNNNTAFSSGDLVLNGNRFVNNSCTSTTGDIHYINSSGLITNTFASITATNNLVSNCSATINGLGVFYGIYNNTASANTLSLSRNTFTNCTLTSSTGAVYFLYNRGVTGSLFTTLKASDNVIAGLTHSNNATGVLYGIVSVGTASTSCSTQEITDNAFVNSISSGTGGGMVLLYNTCPASASIGIANNLFSNWTNSTTTTGSFYAINNGGGSPSGDLAVTGNTFTNLVSAASSGSRYLIYNSGGIGGTLTFTNNLVSGCSHSTSAGGYLYGIYNNSSVSAASAVLSQNTFTNNLSAMATGNVYLLFNNGLVTNTISSVAMENNVIGNYTHNAVGGAFHGVFNAGFASSDVSIASNTLSNLGFSTSNTGQNLLYNSGRVSNTVTIANNLVAGVSSTLSNAGTFNGILSAANYTGSSSPLNLYITNNRFLNTELIASNGSIYFINNNGATTNTISVLTITNNLISMHTNTITGSGNFFGFNNSSIAAGDLTLSQNTLTNITANTTSSARNMILNAGLTLNSAELSNNTVANITSSLNTTGSYFAISNTGAAQGDVNISSNTLMNHSLSATSGTAYVLYNAGAVTNSLSFAGNMISGITHSAASNGGFLGIYNNGVSAASLRMTANTFTNLSLYSSSGLAYMFYNRGAASNTISTLSVMNNLVGACTYSSIGGQFAGILNSGASYGNLSVTSNTFLNTVSGSATAPRYFVYNTGPGLANMTVSDNLFSTFTSTLNTTGSFYGINNGGNIQGDLTVMNNSFLNHNLSATTGSAFVIYNTGVVSNTIAIRNNTASGLTHSATTSGGFLGMYNNATSSAELSITSNSIINTNLYTSTGATHYFYNRGAASSTIGTINISDNTVSGSNYSASSGPFYGVFNSATSFSILNISGNTFNTIVSTSSTSARYFVYNTGAGMGQIAIGTNTVSDYAASAMNTTGAFYNVFNSGACAGNLDVSGNTFSTQVLPSTTGAAYMIYNTGQITGSMTISGNQASALSHSSTTGVLYGLYNNGVNCTDLSISSNTLNGISTTNSVSVKYLIYNQSSAANTIRVNNNSVSNYSAPANTSGNFAGIYNTGSTLGSFEASGNQFRSLLVPATTGTCYMVYNTGTITGTSGITNNSVSNVTSTSSGAGTFYGVYNLSSAASSVSISGNTFSASSVSVPTVAVYLIYNTGAASVTAGSIVMDNNSAVGFTNTLGSGALYGVFNNTVSSSNLSLSGNTFSNCVSSTTNSLRYLVYNTGSVTASMSLSNNTVAGCTSSLNTAANLYGVYNSAFCAGSLDMSANAFTGNFLDATTGTTYFVYNTAAVTGSVGMNNNLISGNTNSATTTGEFYGVYNAGATARLSLNGNAFSGNASAATTANTYLLYNTGAVSGSLSVSSNTLGYSFTNTNSNYSGTLYNIYNTGGAVTTTLHVAGNTFTGYAFQGLTGVGAIYFVYNTNNNKRYDITGNTWSSVSLNHDGNEYLIYNPSSTSSELNVLNNSVTGYTRTANASALYMYYGNGSSPAGSTQIFSGNNFSGISAGTQGTGSFYGIYNADGNSSSFPRKLVYNNSISNVNYNGLGFFYGYYIDFLGDASSAGSSVYSNTLGSVSWAGPLYGLSVGGNVSSAFAANIYSNTIQNLSTTGTTSELYGAYLTGGGSGLNVYANKLSDLSSGGILGVAEGARVNGTTVFYNNIIGNIYTPLSSAASPLNGIYITAGAKASVYYNTVYLNATSTSSAFGSNALYASSSASLELRNNILINTSVPSGSGLTVAYRRSTASLTNYLPASNNNNFYTGIPSPNHLVFTDGVVAHQTLLSYQALVTPRDNASVSENTPFLSTAGTSTNFLHIDPTIPSVTESGASAIPLILTDYDNQVRQGAPGYTGSGTAPDIGADEFNQNLTPCSTANAGTVTVPSTAVKCSGQSVYMLSAGSTPAGDLVHQWKVGAVSGGPYSNVSGGYGANTTAYTSGTLAAGNYYFVLVTTCTLSMVSHTSNEVTVHVSPSPSATASVLNSVICSGQSLSFSGGSSTGITYAWMGPDSFTSTAQSPILSNAVTNASGTYTLLVSDANCTSAPALITVTVNPTPPSFSLSPLVSSVCIGGSQTITASIPVTSPTLSFGSQTQQNTASTYPAPYSVYYGGQKMQMLILANELAAAGFTTGTPIHSIQFPVTALGSNWGSSLVDCQNFSVGMKATSVNMLSVFETGVSNVVPVTNFTPGTGYGNIHSFSAPFIWDGSSNLVIETVFSNSVVGTSGNAVIQYHSGTGFQSTLVYRADNQPVSAIAAATTSNVNVGFVRPDFRLNGAQVGTYSWSPANGLSSTTGASVVASPSASGIYSVQLSDGQCASSSTVALEVIQVPTITISSSGPTVCLGNTTTLTASGAATYTWSTNSTQTAIVVAPFVSTTYTVSGSNPACPVTSATVLVSTAPALTLNLSANPALLCQGESSTLTVSGASTYTWTGGSNAGSISVSPSITTSYTVYAAAGPGCWTSKAVSVKVNPLPTVSITPSTATICLGESLSLEASGVFSFTWSPDGSNLPILSVSPLASAVYTVRGSDFNNCSNTASVSIVVEPCTGIQGSVAADKTISVFPNPSAGLVTLQFSSAGTKKIRVENSLGVTVYSTELQNLSGDIDLSGFSKGLYLVKIDSPDFSGTYKLIIQ